MSLRLVIRDGRAGWQTEDIWVVPGADPFGSPGRPLAGRSNFIWARVWNETVVDRPNEGEAQDARVDFFVSRPGFRLLRSTAHRVGSSSVNVAAHSAAEVLCVVPWTPPAISGGHYCLIAEVTHWNDDVPNALPDQFQPAKWHHIAQRNVDPILLSKDDPRPVTFPVEVVRPMEALDENIEIQAFDGDNVGLTEALLRNLGLDGQQRSADKLVEVSLSTKPGTPSSPGPSSIRLQVPHGESRALYLTAFPTGSTAAGYQHIRLLARAQHTLVGGLDYLFLNE